jgi:hydroxyethylthiazole kinase-like uncharacterized protein yjeF
MKPIVTAEEMRAAEASVIAAGTSVENLMDRAGTAAAEAIWRYAGPLPTLVVCGPGNNGGDGYVIARSLARRGVKVRVAALSEPRTDAARWARSTWDGPVESYESAEPEALLVDSLFGTGLARPLDASAVGRLAFLAGGACVKVAVDLPSGVATDDGSLLSPVPEFDLTITFGTMKPSHLLQPAARYMGRMVIADIGIPIASNLFAIDRPRLMPPGPDDHKYCRGYVAVMQGTMPGAAALTAGAAVRAGAGYVRLIGDTVLTNVPKAVVQDGASYQRDDRIDALALGPGLGRGGEAEQLLGMALASNKPLVLDADALTLLRDRLDVLASLQEPAILTPHAGEFERLFGTEGGSKIARCRAASKRTGAVILFKGPDSVVAAPDGRAAIAPAAPAWLASAGTGDALTGIVAAMRARGLAPFDAACAALWIHGRAADRAGPFLIADDLVEQLPGVLDECM